MIEYPLEEGTERNPYQDTSYEYALGFDYESIDTFWTQVYNTEPDIAIILFRLAPSYGGLFQLLVRYDHIDRTLACIKFFRTAPAHMFPGEYY